MALENDRRAKFSTQWTRFISYCLTDEQTISNTMINNYKKLLKVNSSKIISLHKYSKSTVNILENFSHFSFVHTFLISPTFLHSSLYYFSGTLFSIILLWTLFSLLLHFSRLFFAQFSHLYFVFNKFFVSFTFTTFYYSSLLISPTFPLLLLKKYFSNLSFQPFYLWIE